MARVVAASKWVMTLFETLLVMTAPMLVLVLVLVRVPALVAMVVALVVMIRTSVMWCSSEWRWLMGVCELDQTSKGRRHWMEVSVLSSRSRPGTGSSETGSSEVAASTGGRRGERENGGNEWPKVR